MGDNAEHSLLSASAAPRWTRCYGSVALESTVPNNGSKYAAEGTAMHGLGAFLLSGEPNKEITAELLAARKGMGIPTERAAHWIGVDITADGQVFMIDDEFASAVQEYVDYCTALGGIGLVETKVNYANWLGVTEELAWGTSDFITVYDTPEVIAIDEDGYLCAPDYSGARIGRLIMRAVDLKGGKGVAVHPRHNEQAMLYLGGSLNEIDHVIDVRDDDIICAVIHQPRIGEGEPQEWYLTVGELKHWLRGEAATAAAHAVQLHMILKDEYEGAAGGLDFIAKELTPGDKQCRFCNAKSVCPALTKLVIETTAEAFTDLTLPEPTALTLAEKFALIPMIQETIKAWQEDTKASLLSGQPVGELWLKKGKKGDRAWANIEAAAKKLKAYLGAPKAMKPPEPISPTQAEKLLSPKQYAALQKLGLITQAPPGPTIALPGEKGEPYEVPKPEFTNLAEDADDLSYGADLV